LRTDDYGYRQTHSKAANGNDRFNHFAPHSNGLMEAHEYRLGTLFVIMVKVGPPTLHKVLQSSHAAWA
jgi:hypothetical protein